MTLAVADVASESFNIITNVFKGGFNPMAVVKAAKSLKDLKNLVQKMVIIIIKIGKMIKKTQLVGRMFKNVRAGHKSKGSTVSKYFILQLTKMQTIVKGNNIRTPFISCLLSVLKQKKKKKTFSPVRNAHASRTNSLFFYCFYMADVSIGARQVKVFYYRIQYMAPNMLVAPNM